MLGAVFAPDAAGLAQLDVPRQHLPSGSMFKLPAFLKLTNTDPFAAWFVVTGDPTPDWIRVVRSVLGAISSLPIVFF